MNRQALAISILEQAREILAARLIERVLEAREEILQDARGESYLGEIEALHEQIGSRIGHLTQILANMPPHGYEAGSPTFGEDDDWTPSPPAAVEVDLAFASGAPGSASEYVGVSWPAGLSGRPHEVGASRAALLSLQAVSARIQTGEIESAGRILASLFELPVERGQRCVEFFANRISADAGCLARTASLRHFLEDVDAPEPAEILQDCFGLSEAETRRAIELLGGA